jgi:hypothetical protein
MIVGFHTNVVEYGDGQFHCRDCDTRFNASSLNATQHVCVKKVPIERALATQVAGGHYKNLPVQPAEFCHKNKLGKLEGDVVYYVTRWRQKNGLEDLRKARHTLDILIELESGS